MFTVVMFDSKNTFYEVKRISYNLSDLYSGKLVIERKLAHFFAAISSTDKYSTGRVISAALNDAMEEIRYLPVTEPNSEKTSSRVVYLFARVPPNTRNLSEFLRKNITSLASTDASVIFDDCELAETLKALFLLKVKFYWIHSLPRKLERSGQKEYNPRVYDLFENWIQSFTKFQVLSLSSLLLDRRIIAGRDVLKCYEESEPKSETMIASETNILINDTNSSAFSLYFRAQLCTPSCATGAEAGRGEIDEFNSWGTDSVMVLQAFVKTPSLCALHDLNTFHSQGALLTPMCKSNNLYEPNELQSWSAKFAGLMLELSRRNVCLISQERSNDEHSKFVRNVLIRPVTPLSATVHRISSDRLNDLLNNSMPFLFEPGLQVKGWTHDEAKLVRKSSRNPSEAPSKFFQTYLPSIFDLDDDMKENGCEKKPNVKTGASSASLFSSFLESADALHSSYGGIKYKNQPNKELDDFLMSVKIEEEGLVADDRKKKGDLLLDKLRREIKSRDAPVTSCKSVTSAPAISACPVKPVLEDSCNSDVNVPLGGIPSQHRLNPSRRRLVFARIRIAPSKHDTPLKSCAKESVEAKACFPDCSTLRKHSIVKLPSETPDEKAASACQYLPFVERKKGSTPETPVSLQHSNSSSLPKKDNTETSFAACEPQDQLHPRNVRACEADIADDTQEQATRGKTVTENLQHGIARNFDAFYVCLELLEHEDSHSSIQRYIDQSIDTLASIAGQLAKASKNRETFDCVLGLIRPFQITMKAISSKVHSARNTIREVVDPTKDPVPVSVWIIILRAFFQSTLCLFDAKKTVDGKLTKRRVSLEKSQAFGILVCIQTFTLQMPGRNNTFLQLFAQYFEQVLGTCLHDEPSEEMCRAITSLFDDFELPLPTKSNECNDAESVCGATSETPKGITRSYSQSSIHRQNSIDTERIKSKRSRNSDGTRNKKRRKVVVRDPGSIISAARKKIGNNVAPGRVQFRDQHKTSDPFGDIKKYNNVAKSVKPKSASSAAKRKGPNHISSALIAEKLRLSSDASVSGEIPVGRYAQDYLLDDPPLKNLSHTSGLAGNSTLRPESRKRSLILQPAVQRSPRKNNGYVSPRKHLVHEQYGSPRTPKRLPRFSLSGPAKRLPRFSLSEPVEMVDTSKKQMSKLRRSPRKGSASNPISAWQSESPTTPKRSSRVSRRTWKQYE